MAMGDFDSNNIEVIIAAIRNAGYNYAKAYYQDWGDTFAEELMDELSNYYKSTDENGNPLKEVFESQIHEQSYHLYCSGTNDDFFDEFQIEGFYKEERDSVMDEYLFGFLWDGMVSFAEEKYN